MDDRLRDYMNSMHHKKEENVVQNDVMDMLKKIKEEKKESEKNEVGEKVLIIDGLNLFIRNWVVVPTMDINGEHCGGTVGFIRSLKMLIRENKPTKVLVVWDGHGGSTKRRSMYGEYKAGRKLRVNREYDFDNPDKQQENMHLQNERVKRYINLLGITQIEVENVEADDVIALLCKHMLGDTKKIVVTSDKDMLQLVDEHTLIYSPIKKIYFSCDKVKEVMGVLAENYIYMKAFTGDGSDNIPGLKGIGPKTVLKLFPFLADVPTRLEEIFDYCGKNSSSGTKYKMVTEHKNELIRNVKLMQLTVPIISTQSVQVVREALERKLECTNFTELKLEFVRDGIQIDDNDFFTVFREYNLRAGKGE